MGESIWARRLRPPCADVQFGSNSGLDLLQFDWQRHKSIRLESVNAVSWLLRWRAELQATPGIVALGASATMCHAHHRFLWRIPIVATLGTSVENWELLDSDPRLLENAVCLRVDAPMWQTPTPTPPTRDAGSSHAQFAQKLLQMALGQCAHSNWTRRLHDAVVRKLRDGCADAEAAEWVREAVTKHTAA